MTEIINIKDYRERREVRKKKAALIDKMNTKMTKEEADYTVLQLLDIFCQKRYPNLFWEFDLFIDNKME